MRTTQRAIMIAAVALCGVLVVALPSYAGDTAQLVSPTQSVFSGEWGATPSTTSLAFGTQNTQYIYFFIANTGTLPLTGATYTLSGSSLKANTTLSLQACVGGSWNIVTNVCSGTVQSIMSTTGTTIGSTVTTAGLFPAAAGANVTLQAQISKTPSKTSVALITVTVDRSEVRAATIANG